MAEKRFMAWLRDNNPKERKGSWLPFLNGWVFRAYADGNIHGKGFELRLFHNGAICLNFDMYSKVNQGTISLEHLEAIIKHYIIGYGSKAIGFMKINGPFSLQVNLYNVKDLKTMHKEDDDEEGGNPIDSENKSFVEETSAEELQTNPERILSIVNSRFAALFGVWKELKHG